MTGVGPSLAAAADFFTEILAGVFEGTSLADPLLSSASPFTAGPGVLAEFDPVAMVCFTISLNASILIVLSCDCVRCKGAYQGSGPG